MHSELFQPYGFFIEKRILRTAIKTAHFPFLFLHGVASANEAKFIVNVLLYLYDKKYRMKEGF